ncbi:MAG: nucleotidyltransferase domain-containing protein [Methanobacteriota archaeon]|nr:MAG: nucleotidyltransferase domain-containing protein [Euryarchaeota archaeon]
MSSPNRRTPEKVLNHSTKVSSKSTAFASDEELFREIVRRITAHVNVKRIILFGSYATGKVHEDSDIDLVVVLDEPGFAQDYEAFLQHRQKVSRLFYDIRKKVPMDFLVYTRDEWKKLVESDSYFIKEILETGLDLI